MRPGRGLCPPTDGLGGRVARLTFLEGLLSGRFHKLSGRRMATSSDSLLLSQHMAAYPGLKATEMTKNHRDPKSSRAMHEEGKGGGLFRDKGRTDQVACLPKYIEATMPDGVAIGSNAFGLGLFATVPFRAGDTLYTTSCLYVPDVSGTVVLRLADSGQEYTLNMEEHSVVQSDLPGKRQLYTYDALMNHACSPNTASFVTACTSEELTYGMKALRAIAAGEELTCDYTLFEFEAGEASIPVCRCGSSDCLGRVKGFRHLTFSQTLPRLPYAEPYVVTSYLDEHPEVSILDLRQNPKSEARCGQSPGRGGRACAIGEGGIQVSFGEGGGCRVVSSRVWSEGETILAGVGPALRSARPWRRLEGSRALIVILAPGVVHASARLDPAGVWRRRGGPAERRTGRCATSLAAACRTRREGGRSRREAVGGGT